MASTSSLIKEMEADGELSLALENYGYLIHAQSDICMMSWRNGDNPRPDIAEMLGSYHAMLEFKCKIDPNSDLAMDAFAGNTDWDLVYSLFWLADTPMQAAFSFPKYVSHRYFAYSRYLLCLLLDTEVSEELQNAVDEFSQSDDELVDRNFQAMMTLLNGSDDPDAASSICRQIEKNWNARKNDSFYRSDAHILAGADKANGLSLDYQLACVLKKRSIRMLDCLHAWRWD